MYQYRSTQFVLAGLVYVLGTLKKDLCIGAPECNIYHAFPDVFLLVSCIVYVPLLLNKGSVKMNRFFHALFILRIIGSIAFAIIDVHHSPQNWPFISLSGFVLIIICIVEKDRGHHPTFIPCLYMFFSLSRNLPILHAIVFTQDTPQWYNCKCYDLASMIQITILVTVFIVDVLIPTRAFTLESNNYKVIPLFSSNLLSRACFTWMIPQFITSQKRWITLDDLYCYPPNDGCRESFHKLEYHTNRQSEQFLPRLVNLSKKSQLVLSVIRPLLPTLIGSLAMRLFGIFLLASQFLVYRDLIRYIEKNELDTHRGLMLCLRFVLAYVASMLFQIYHLSITYYLSARCNGICNALVMDKLLRGSLGQHSRADTLNHITVDVQRASAIISECNVGFETIVYGPFMCYIIWDYFGMASIYGVATAVGILIFCNTYLQKKINKTTVEERTAKSKRISIIDDILSGIKAIKLYTWERYFEEKVSEARRVEQNFIQNTFYVSNIQVSFFLSSQYVVLITITCYYMFVEFNSEITAEKIFVSIMAVGSFCRWALYIPFVMIFFTQGKTSIERLLSFLLQPDSSTTAIDQSHEEVKKGSVRIDCTNVYAAWHGSDRAVISNVNLTINSGELVAIVGTVGSGKTTLLSTILGASNILRGRISLKGSVAYTAQASWVMQATIRDNILLCGKPYDRALFEKVLQACGLGKDLENFPQGDLTDIGEKGCTLSGGQKQRLSLARAVYSDADIYLLDDPLSAVDTHVASHIFQEVIGPKGILKHKTRLFVTNDLQMLPSVDRIIVVENGQIVETGNFHGLKLSRGALFKDIGSSKLNESAPKYHEDSKSISPLIKDEVMEHEKASLSTFTFYGSLFGWIPWSGIVLGLLCGAYCITASNLVVARYSIKRNVSNSRQDLEHMHNYFVAYGILRASTFVLTAFSLTFGIKRASRSIHAALMKRILNARVTFFDTTPLGRIMNWFTRDMEIIDFGLKTVAMYIIWCLPLLSSMLYLSLFSPLVLLVTVCVWVFLFQVLRVYSNYLRELKRIEGVHKSPVFSLFRETMEGIQTIKSYQIETVFFDKFCSLVDDSTRPSWHLAMAKGLTHSLSMMGSILIYFVLSITCVLFRHQMEPAVAVVALTSSSELFQIMMVLMQNLGELESMLVSVERVTGGNNMEEEDYTSSTDAYKGGYNWKNKESENKGTVVEFKGYYAKYRPELNYVLKDITIGIQEKEKIGIVGRTGAGKSSIALALVRMVEASHGEILIDGYNIATMGLHELRSKVTVVCQDPVIFKGTIRDNLDPTNQYEDIDLCGALEKVHLKDFLASLDGIGDPLRCECRGDEEVISIGQRQLLSLARALLHQSRILVLDESTSAIDVNTDSVVQRMLRTDLKHTTLITIAHRIKTVIDYDRVIVMEEGSIVEVGSPSTLLSNNSTKFYQYAKQAGLVP